MTNKRSSSFTMATTILALAGPTMLEQLMQTAVQYIDTAMVGTLGTQATAAVGSTSTVNWLVGSTISAIGVGFLAYISKSLGKEDAVDAKKAAGQAVIIVAIVGILFTIITTAISGVIPTLMQVDPNIRSVASKYFLILYLPMLPRTASIILGTVLRSAGDTKTPMKIGIYLNLINVVLNFFFIYPSRYITVFSKHIFIPGFGMGVVGAAAASAIAFTFGGIAIFISLLKHPVIAPQKADFKPDKVILSQCFRVAMPNCVQRFGTSLGYVVFASMINSLGDVATAAHTVANTVESAFYIPGFGMQTAAATLAGNAYGANDKEKMKRLTRIFIPIEIILMLLSGALLFITAPYLVRLFSKSPDVITLGVTVLRMVALSEPFYGFSIIVEGFMHGVGNTKTPMLYNVIGMWCVRIIGAFITTKLLHMGLVSAWACMIGHNMFIFILYMISYSKGTWNPLKTER